MNIRKIMKLHNYILVIFLILFSTIIFNNKTIEKETKTFNNKVKALNQEGQNYRLVTSADNVQVPVPKGYVASNITGENYVSPEYQYITNTYKVQDTETQLNWSSPVGEEYPWTQDENGIWISGNQGIHNSESVLESEEFDYVKGTTLTINYTYSCQYGDYLSIYLINTTNNSSQRAVVNAGNMDSSFDYTTSTETYTMNDWKTGRYKIRAVFSKNPASNGGLDRGYIKSAKYFKKDENGTQIIEDEIKTRIHDGGFVIYQLTDEELETDPNGTNVIINDTNKDIAQSTRNQYVWVPIPNVEDIVRTKIENRGIIQLGQAYSFKNTEIKKQNNTSREPLIVKECDKTKYNLQKYSNINKRENNQTEHQIEFKNLIRSVEKYKGYYIGRYETGDEDTHSYYSKECYTRPKIVKYNYNINYVTWYDSYKDLERLAGNTEKYVETGMLYDTLWANTLKWFYETDTRTLEDIVVNSATWGNYTNVKLKYKESADGTEITKELGEDIITPTGGVSEIVYKGEKYIDSPTASNNIFDLTGNTLEWIRAKWSEERRIMIGGLYSNFSNQFPASLVDGYYPDNLADSYGSRGMLLIK